MFLITFTLVDLYEVMMVSSQVYGHGKVVVHSYIFTACYKGSGQASEKHYLPCPYKWTTAVLVGDVYSLGGC